MTPARQSIIDLLARERAQALLDSGSFRELLGPFDRLESPWLAMQGIVPQSDDGVVIARGQLDGRPAVLLAIEGAFQGGGVGEVSGSKIAAALRLARHDAESGRPVLPVLLLETGGVRLQEANLGEAAVAEVHAEIVALRRLVPVLGVVTGMIGCFGGMAIAVGLCSYVIVLPQARLELNGPEVIEQEAGRDELDAGNRQTVWCLMGGEQRYRSGLADALVEDDVQAVRQAITSLGARGVPARHRSEEVDVYQRRLSDTSPSNATDGSGEPSRKGTPSRRGRAWFEALSVGGRCVETGLGGLLVADAPLVGETVRVLAVVPGSNNRFPRARHGEIGLEEGWALARHVRDAIAADVSGVKRSLVAVVDVKSQAYGRIEAQEGIHLALAAAVDAYATARMAGHPVVALVVGSAISGGLLAHGGQAHRLLALDDPGVTIHAMAEEPAARVTRRSVAELEKLGETVLPMAYDIRRFARLGLLHELISGIDADAPTAEQVAHVQARLAAAIADVRARPGDLLSRLDHPHAKITRAASIEVYRRLAEQWNQ